MTTMIQVLPAARGVPRPAIDSLIAQHGAWAVLRSVLLALARPRPPVSRDLGQLNPHLRRDIGLPPVERAPQYWELRR